MKTFLATIGLALLSTAAQARNVAPGTWDMEAVGQSEPSDHMYQLHLDYTPALGSFAILETNQLIMCAPLMGKSDFVQLHFAGEDCGSTIWKGSAKNEGKSPDFIKITDHRTRVCKDLVPAQIIVERVNEEWDTSSTLYCVAP